MQFLRALLILPFLMCAAAPAFAQQSTLTGVVTDDAGRPIAAARIAIEGSHAATTMSDAQGRFGVPLPPGVYSIVATHAGYEQVTLTSVTVSANGTTDVRVAMPVVTLSSLRAIARVEAASPGVFNAGSYPISVLSSQRFLDSGAIGIAQILNETPGIVAARPNADAAVYGSTTSPNMRGALDYEKETLIDGHPLINGSHGDYPTMLIDSMLFDDIEIAKGPTAYASEINYGIGGTMNFRTGDPTLVPTERAIFGVDNFDGSFANVRATGSAGRLGWVVDLSSYGTGGPLHDYASEIAVSKGTIVNGYGTITGTTTSGTSLNGQHGPYPVPFSIGSPTNAYATLLACCQIVNSNYLTRGEVTKLYYHLSDATVIDVGYVGIQGSYDGPAGSFGQFDTTFSPAAGYAFPGALYQPGMQIPIAEKSTFPDAELYDTEPMFESDLRSTIGDDTVLARYYSEVYLRQTTSNMSSPSANYMTGPFVLYGTAALNGHPTPTVFDGTTTALTFPTPYSSSVEHDSLHGYSFEDDHPIGNGQLTFEYDRTTALTNAYSVVGSATHADGLLTTSIAAGTRQDFNTYLLRGTFNLGSEVTLTLANYFNVYNTHYTPQRSASGAFLFSDVATTHDDPRIGLSFRPAPNVAVRFSAGSAVAPPYPALTNVLNQTPAQAYTTGSTFVTITKNSGVLLPETSFGYDLGTDVRLPTGAVISFDAYLTNLRNQFDTIIYPDGTYNSPGGMIPVYASTTVNLGNSRYEGLEAMLRQDPARGIGYTVSVDFQRAYPYDIAPCFYATAAKPCPGYGTNLLVIPGINFEGNGTGYNGISNKSEAYAMGYAGVHARGGFGQYAEFGFTYFGKNNTYDVPPFFVASASYRIPLGTPSTTLQIAADNLFNADDARVLEGYSGIPAPLINGDIGLRNAIPYGPPSVRVSVGKSF
jgi:hypothetical protein